MTLISWCPVFDKKPILALMITNTIHWSSLSCDRCGHTVSMVLCIWYFLPGLPFKAGLSGWVRTLCSLYLLLHVTGSLQSSRKQSHVGSNWCGSLMIPCCNVQLHKYYNTCLPLWACEVLTVVCTESWAGLKSVNPLPLSWIMCLGLCSSVIWDARERCVSGYLCKYCHKHHKFNDISGTQCVYCISINHL